MSKKNKKQCDAKSCKPYYDELNWICDHCDALIDPDNPPWASVKPENPE